MRDQHWFRALQVRVRRHCSLTNLFGAIKNGRNQRRKLFTDFVAAGAEVQAEIGRNLLVAAASAVQLIASVPDQSDQLLLDEVVNVFGLGIVQKLWRIGSFLPDQFQSSQH